MSLNALTANDSALEARLREWRQDIHKHAEIAFEEYRTARLVAERLAAMGIEVTTEIGKTGVVGILKKGSSHRSIGLRADMDALPMQERTGLPYASINEGCFHGCGHDGHTTMLLGAAEILKDVDFDGRIVFIFQPAEEGERGAVAMMDDGLFERWPVDKVYGMHNWPKMPLGSFGVRTGQMAAAFETFDIKLHGRGGHAAMPEESADPIPATAALVQALQTIIARNLSPVSPAVLSITRISSGSAYNVIPDDAAIAGCIRYFEADAGALIRKRMAEITQSIAAGFDGSAELHTEKVFTTLVNEAEATNHCIDIASDLVGADNVDTDHPLIMASEDFAFMLEKVPGCYIMLGTSESPDGSMLHNPGYDFNDNALMLGVKYWVELARRSLAPA